MNHKIEVEKQFSPTDQDRRVGWVRTAAAHQSEFVAVDVVTATVESRDGAEVGYIQRQFGERLSFPTPYQKGLGRVAAFSGFLSNEREWQEEFSLEYVPQDMTGSYRGPKAEELLVNGTGDNRNYVETVTKVWAESPHELIDILKHELAKLDFEDVYEMMYYWMNGAIQRDYPGQSALTDVPPESLLIPDSTMADQTANQLEHMYAMENALNSSVQNDVAIRHRLMESIDDTAIDERPDQFIRSRQRAAALEATVIQAANQLTVNRLAYVPVGHGRASRTWPFMDTTEQDPHKAYGIELHELRAGRTDRAVRELDEEIKELRARRELASEAIARFKLLNQLEQSS